MKPEFFLAFVIITATPALSQKKADNKKYSLDQLTNTSFLQLQDISTNGTKVLYISNETGANNSYEYDVPTGKKRSLIRTDESVFPAGYLPGSHCIFFRIRKPGGNPRLYIQKSDGTIHQVTLDEHVSYALNINSSHTKYFYFVSNKRSKQQFDLYRIDTISLIPELIYENNSIRSIEEVSPDDKYIIAAERLSPDSINLYLLDINTKEAKKINSDDSKNQFVSFSSDGKYFYYLTNMNREYKYAMEFNTESGERKQIFATDKDIIWFTVKNRKLVQAFTGKGVYLFDHNGNSLHQIEKDIAESKYYYDVTNDRSFVFPRDGVTAQPNVRIAGDIYTLQFSSSTSNSIYLYDFKRKKYSKIASSAPDVNEDDLVAAQEIRFLSFDGLQIPAFLYKPHAANSKNKVPAIVMLHGGPWSQTVKYYNPFIQYLLNNGFVIFDINYRGSSGYGEEFLKMSKQDHGTKDVKDVVWAKKYLQTLPYVDTSGIGVMGFSYGGFLTLAALAFYPDEFKAGADWYGPSDWQRILKGMPESWTENKKNLYAELGDPFTDDSVHQQKYSPRLHAGNIKKPLIIFHGSLDQSVPQAESDDIIAVLKKNKVTVEYFVFPNEGHAFFKKENIEKAWTETLNFFNKYLRRKR